MYKIVAEEPLYNIYGLSELPDPGGKNQHKLCFNCQVHRQVSEVIILRNAGCEVSVLSESELNRADNSFESSKTLFHRFSQVYLERPDFGVFTYQFYPCRILEEEGEQTILVYNQQYGNCITVIARRYPIYYSFGADNAGSFVRISSDYYLPAGLLQVAGPSFFAPVPEVKPHQEVFVNVEARLSGQAVPRLLGEDYHSYYELIEESL